MNRYRTEPIEIPIAWNGDGAVVGWRRAPRPALRRLLSTSGLVFVGALLGWVLRGLVG